jgi:hypothetical protein
MRLTGVHLKHVSARNYNTDDSLMKLDDGYEMPQIRRRILAERGMIFFE